MIKTKFVNYDYDHFLADYCEIKKTRKLILQKYCKSNFCDNKEIFIKDYDFCLTSKIVKHKTYSNL